MHLLLSVTIGIVKWCSCRHDDDCDPVIGIVSFLEQFIKFSSVIYHSTIWYASVDKTMSQKSKGCFANNKKPKDIIHSIVIPETISIDFANWIISVIL